MIGALRRVDSYRHDDSSYSMEEHCTQEFGDVLFRFCVYDVAIQLSSDVVRIESLV